MKEALTDVTPANDEICLMMPQQNGGKSNKRKKVNAEKKISKGRAHIASMSEEQKVCAKALECLGFLLVYHGVLMKQVLFYVMQEKITSIAFMISSKIQQDGDLYRDPTCRSRLTDVIGFMMIHPVNKMPVPMNYGIALLTKFKQNDPDSNVRDAASMNLYRAETAIHNRKDVFYFPAEYKELKDTLNFNKLTVQKFNQVRQETGNGAAVEVDDEPMLEEENVVISDEESKKAPEKLNPPKQDEVNEISDESEPEADESQPKVDETFEISDEDEEHDILEAAPENPEPEPETPKRSTRKSVADKRQTKVESPKSSPKKRKVTDKKQDEILDEMMADFNE